ncbi:MAG: rhomboid family intramembrane serine protease [Ferruginibacter sp.]
MTGTGIIGLLLIVANIIFSYKGLTNTAFFDGYKFEVDPVLVKKDYKRLITAGFLHVSWTHLIFNMISLYAFSGLIEADLGGFKFLLVYFTSLVGGNLFSLFIHRHHGDYSAAGASGAICGIIFSSIALFPGMGIGFFGLPFSIPGWLYGIIYVLYSVYGIRSGKDNIGHEAHLGGGLIGMATALLIEPAAFLENYQTILIIAVPAIAFIYLVISRPYTLLVDNLFYKTHQDHYSIDHKYNEERANNQKEIDRILDKINRSGMNSLSKKEKEKLKSYSQKTQ